MPTSSAPAELYHPTELTELERQLVADLADYVQQVMRVYRTPGLTIALSHAGREIWRGAFGWADVRAKVAATNDTTIRSGSMGKVYTATAVMQLVEQGILHLDAPVNDYLTTFRVTNPLGSREITLRDLLTHRSGLAPNGAGSDFVAPPPLGDHLARVYADQRNDFYGGTAAPFWTAPVGETPQYSNTGIATVGHVVAATNPEGLSFSDYVQRHVLDPLRMASSQYPPVQDAEHVRPDLFARLSTGYSRVGAVHVPTPAVYFADHPAGTVITTAADHLRLLMATQYGGALDGVRVLREDTVTQMLDVQCQLQPGAHVGLVWMVMRSGEVDESFGHSGAHMWGWTNIAKAYPRQDFAIVVCANQWGLMEGAHSPRYPEGDRISSFVSTWLRERTAERPRPTAKSWAWKRSYVIGMIVVDRLMGMLSIPTPMTDQQIDEMADNALVDVAPATDGWDADGFRSGVRDLLGAELTTSGITQFLQDGTLGVPREELELLFADLGNLTGAAALPGGAQ